MEYGKGGREMSEQKDPPIDETDFTFGGGRVVDFGDLRVARGKSRRAYSICQHLRLMYDATERRIWCKDCERDVDAFEAFTGIAEHFRVAESRIARIKAEALEAQNHALHLIAARNLEAVWRGRKMAPTCPHCTRGLLPDDFKKVGGRVSVEFEQARRQREKEKGKI